MADEVARRIRSELGNSPRPTSFSNAGYSALIQIHSEYMGDLATESIRQARRDKSDVVSASQVEEAAERLQSTPRGFLSLELFGGVIAGGGFSQVLTNSLDENPTTQAWLISFGITFLGFLMIVASIIRRART